MSKYLFFFLCLLNSLLASSCIQGALSIGYRWDRIQQQGDANIETTNLNGFASTLSYFDRRLSPIPLIGGQANIQGFFDVGFYFNTKAYFGWILADVKDHFSHLISGIKTTNTMELKETQYALDLMGTIGWQMKGLNDRVNFIPQIGAAVYHIKINQQIESDGVNSVKFYFPLAGTTLLVFIERHWQIMANIYYIFLGKRREQIQLFNGQNIPAIKQGIVHGMEGLVNISYLLTPKWSLFLQYVYRQVKAKAKRNSFESNQFLNLKTKWFSNQIELGLSYIF